MTSQHSTYNDNDRPLGTVAEAGSRSYVAPCLVSVDETGKVYQYKPDSAEAVDGDNVLAVANPTGQLVSTTILLQQGMEANTEKLTTIEDDATADQTPEEIVSAYSSLVPQITTAEISDGTGQAIRSTSPANLKDMIASHAGQGVKNNISSSVNPSVNDDSDSGYDARSIWINQASNKSFICHDAMSGAAVWAKITLTADELATVAATGAYADLSGKPDLSPDGLRSSMGLAEDDDVLFGGLEAAVIRGSSVSGEDLAVHSNASEDGLVTLAGTVTVNELNNRVGINNAVPAGAFDVSGDSKRLTTANVPSSLYSLKLTRNDTVPSIETLGRAVIGAIIVGSLAIDSAVTITAADSPYTIPPGVTEINVDSTDGNVDVTAPVALLVPGLLYDYLHFAGDNTVTTTNVINGTANQTILPGNALAFKSKKINGLYEFWRR